MRTFAPFAVEGAEVVGRSVLNSPNSWLATKETFGDFILEYEAKVDPKLNSGVMIRGLSREDYSRRRGRRACSPRKLWVPSDRSDAPR